MGYTACVLASATPSTTVDSVERDPLHVSLARENLRSANLQDRVTVHQGEFSAVIAGLDGEYDVAFFDGLSPTPGLVEDLRALLKPGGVLVCANLDLIQGAEKRTLEPNSHVTTDGRTSGASRAAARGHTARLTSRACVTNHPEATCG